jgi:hypothetical protein
MSIWAASVYLLCFLASVACALLLVRAYDRYKSRLLLWSALCFVALSIDNLLLLLDALVFTEIDLRFYSAAVTFVGLCFLLYGFIWESDRI